jgi:anaerobic selenocysteine-containing dehydrogenase
MILQVKKIDGNPLHPVNRGKLCPKGQAGPQILYNPDRIQTPLKLSGARGTGQYQAVSWDEALTLLESRLQPLRSTSPSSGLGSITGYSSSRRQELMQGFLSAVGSGRCYLEEPPGLPVLREANKRLFGLPDLEVHDFENANYVISFGANILETHTSPVRYNLGLGHFRQGRAGRRGKFVQVEGRFSLTAANADEWLPARPGFEGELALAMAHVILKEKLFDSAFVKASVKGFEGFHAWVLENFAPEKVALAADVPAKRIIRVAREFARHQPGFALAGGAALAHPHGLFTAAAAHSLNALVGNIGRKGGLFWASSPGKRVQDAPASGKQWTERFISEAESIQVLILWDANPLYYTHGSSELAKAISRIPFIVAFSSFMDESTAHADLILPDRTFLERWDLSQPEVTAGARVLSIIQPIVKPLYESRDCADVVLGLAEKWGGTIREKLPDANFAAYLKRSLAGENVLKHGSFALEDIDGYWSKLMETGVWVDDAPARTEASVDLSFITATRSVSPADWETAEYPYSLQPFMSVPLGDGKTSNLPWMQELPDPMSSIVWGSWVEINLRTAEKLGIEENDLVLVASRAGKVAVPAHLTPAARPDVLSIPFGQGHKLYGRYASGRGVNPWDVIQHRLVKDVGEPAWAGTRVIVVRTGEKAPVVRIGYDRERGPRELHR